VYDNKEDVSYVELHLGIPQGITHLILFLLITGKYSNFFDVCLKEPMKDSIPEGAGAAGD